MSSSHVEDAFLEHYGFVHDPFAARPPGFRFFPAQRKPLLGQLHHLARYSQLLLVVSGPRGSGKTLLRQALVASSKKQTTLPVIVSGKNSAQVEGILRQIAMGLGLARADERSILAQVEELAAVGQEVYLLVDDAELLETTALDALLALAEGGAMGRPHVFLFGQPELVARLQSLCNGEERFHVLSLKPYEREETRDYLALRLERAGRDIELFSSEDIDRIHLQSEGWPGEINRIAREVLDEAMYTQQRPVQAPDGGRRGVVLPVRHLLALGVVSLAVAAAWFMRTGPDSETTAARRLVAEDTAAQSPAMRLDSNPPGPAVPATDEVRPVIREPLALAAGDGDEEDMAGAEIAPAALVTGSEDEAPEAVTALPVQVPERAASSLEAVGTPPAVHPVAIPEPPPAVTAAAAPSAPKSAAVVRPVSPSGASFASDWYRSQAAGSYSLQVFATYSENSAKAFLRAQGAGYRYFRKVHQGRPFFVVTYGSFATRNEAQAAIRGLPPKVQAGNPWPRSFASIQREATAEH